MVEIFYRIALWITGGFAVCAIMLTIAMGKIYMNVSRHFKKVQRHDQ